MGLYSQTAYSTNSPAGSASIQIVELLRDLPSTPSQGSLFYVNETQTLFVYDNEYFSKSLTNLPVTIDTPPPATISLNTDGETPTIIVLSATDPEGFSVRWSYIADPGNICIIQQDDNTFTFLPSGNQEDEGSFDMQFIASDGYNQIIVTSTVNLNFLNKFEVSTRIDTASAIDLNDNSPLRYTNGFLSGDVLWIFGVDPNTAYPTLAQVDVSNPFNIPSNSIIENSAIDFSDGATNGLLYRPDKAADNAVIQESVSGNFITYMGSLANNQKPIVLINKNNIEDIRTIQADNRDFAPNKSHIVQDTGSFKFVAGVDSNQSGIDRIKWRQLDDDLNPITDWLGIKSVTPSGATSILSDSIACYKDWLIYHLQSRTDTTKPYLVFQKLSTYDGDVNNITHNAKYLINANISIDLWVNNLVVDHNYNNLIVDFYEFNATPNAQLAKWNLDDIDNNNITYGNSIAIGSNTVSKALTTKDGYVYWIHITTASDPLWRLSVYDSRFNTLRREFSLNEPYLITNAPYDPKATRPFVYYDSTFNVDSFSFGNDTLLIGQDASGAISGSKLALINTPPLYTVGISSVTTSFSGTTQQVELVFEDISWGSYIRDRMHDGWYFRSMKFKNNAGESVLEIEMDRLARFWDTPNSGFNGYYYTDGSRFILTGYNVSGEPTVITNGELTTAAGGGFSKIEFYELNLSDTAGRDPDYVIEFTARRLGQPI